MHDLLLDGYRSGSGCLRLLNSALQLAIAYDIVLFWNFASLVKYATDGIR
jgi:hypothetical protein